MNSGFQSFGQGSMTRLIGIERTFGHPNSVAESIVVSLPMVLFLYRVRRQFTATWSKGLQVRFRWGLLGYTALALSSLVFTNSRAGIVGLVVFAGIAALQGSGLQKKVL